MTNQLATWLDCIEREHRAVRETGLDRIVRLARHLGVVRPASKSVVVAGTNGKGSTVRYLEQLLLESEHSVGATASPHLKHYNERIRVNGKPVDDESIVRAFETIQDTVESTPLTYYEWATLAALVIFRWQRVEYALLEVGLGGRLDAANAIEPDVTVITNIGLDHMHLLGSDRESIGSEKAGILRSGVPLVYGDSCTVRSVMSRAEALGSPLYIAGIDYAYTTGGSSSWDASFHGREGSSSYRFLGTPSMADSASIALQAALLLDPSIELSRCKHWLNQSLPGRMEQFQHRGRDWMLDVAHNPDAARYVRQCLDVRFPHRNVKLLFGCMRDKPAYEMLKMLEIPESRVIVSDTTGDRGIRATDLLDDLGPSRVRVEPELSHAIDYLIESTDPHDLILVTGSFQLVSRVRDVIEIGIGSRR
ncbi:MAG: bifunctional folylpolyglutamate synthase/dihydrofolate synthase [Gammaproteobacteria bacterium]|nr:bifunctional folylpolyglutamate synthase/dihydrofolate synthase [Gammaproteobacteria bacterium]